MSCAQTLTTFALQTPHSLLKGKDNTETREALQDSVIESMNSMQSEDIRDLLLVVANGKPCIETKTTLELEHALGLPGGNIFYAPPNWPFVSGDSPPQLSRWLALKIVSSSDSVCADSALCRSGLSSLRR